MLLAAQQFILSYPEVGYLVVFAGAFLEATAFVGVFVPGTVIVVASGFFAERWPTTFDARAVVVLVSLGAFLGSVASYLLGRYYGPPLFTERGFFLNRRYLIRGQQYFAVHGGKSVFSGHFLGPVRSFISFVAGMAEMRLPAFLAWTLAASVTWGGLYVGVGYFFGASWEAVELWGTRLTLFLFGVAVVLVLNGLVGRFLVRHERQVRLFLFSVARSVGQALVENEYIASFIERHPALFRFLRNRLSPYRVRGLTLTVSVGVSFVVLGYLLALMHAVVAAGPLLGVDQRVLGLVTFVRDPAISRVMLLVTNLAGPPAAGFTAALAVALLVRRRWLRVAVLLGGSGLAAALYTVLKAVFGRARPDPSQALVVEHSASFPSGHAVVATVFFGFLAYTLLPFVRSWRTKVFVVLATVFTVFLIGLSRVYLGVHWPSDILGGYLLGTSVLVAMATTIALGESARPPFVLPAGRRPLATAVAALGIFAAAWFFWSYTASHPLRTVAVGPVEILPRRTVAALTTAELAAVPRTTETLTGRPQAPINLVLVGSRAAVEDAFRGAGWAVADPITIRTAAATVRSSFANTPYPSAPISPSFYNGRVQDLGVEQETPAQTARQRHHARFWLAPVVLEGGRDVWVGTASFDRGIAYSPTLKFPTHVISPDIDRERDFIRAALAATGRVVRQETVDLVEPVVGVNGIGDPFFTDGRAHVLWLRD